jgi:hypothetical protein
VGGIRICSYMQSVGAQAAIRAGHSRLQRVQVLNPWAAFHTFFSLSLTHTIVCVHFMWCAFLTGVRGLCRGRVVQVCERFVVR